MAELVGPSLQDMANLRRSVGPVILERRASDGGWAPVWEYEKSEEASRAVETRVSAHDGSSADYRVRPLEHRSRIQNTALTCIAVVVAICLATLVVALIR